MRKGWMLVAVCALSTGIAQTVAGQASSAAPYTSQFAIDNTTTPKVTGTGSCQCGAHPPAPPRNRTFGVFRTARRGPRP